MASKNYKDFVEELGMFIEDIESGIYIDRMDLQGQLFMCVDEFYEKIYTKKGVDKELEHILWKTTEAYSTKKSIKDILDAIYIVWKEGWMIAYPKSKIFAE